MNTQFMKSSNTKLKFSILQIGFWCTFGAFTSFSAAYFQEKGMSATLIGTMLAVYTLCAFLGQFFWGYICDRMKTNKKVFIITTVLTLGMYFVVYFLQNWYLIIAAYGILGFVQTPIIANLDTWILKYYHDNPETYGPIRSWASLAYALFALFFGRVIESTGYYIMLVFSALFVAVTLVFALITPDAPVVKEKTVAKSSEGNGFYKLLSNKAFLFLLFVLLCTGVACTPVMTMMPLILSGVGGTVTHQGYTMFASAIAQVPFMLFSRKLSYFSSSGRLMFSGIMYLASLILMSVAKTPEIIILGSVLNGIGYGILLPAMRQTIFETTPAKLQTTAQGIGEATYSNLAGMVSSVLAGTLIDNFSTQVMLLTCSAIQLIGIVLLTRGRGGRFSRPVQS